MALDKDKAGGKAQCPKCGEDVNYKETRCPKCKTDLYGEATIVADDKIEMDFDKTIMAPDTPSKKVDKGAADAKKAKPSQKAAKAQSNSKTTKPPKKAAKSPPPDIEMTIADIEKPMPEIDQTIADIEMTIPEKAKPEVKDNKVGKPGVKSEKPVIPEAKDKQVAKPDAKVEKPAKPEPKDKQVLKPGAKIEKPAKPAPQVNKEKAPAQPAAPKAPLKPVSKAAPKKGVGKTMVDAQAEADGDEESHTIVDMGKKEKKISDRYEILEELGRGGMGVVYRAKDLKLGRVVALKRILRSFDTGVARFLQEARAIARLNHQNVVIVHDTGEDNIGPWLVMEYVEGGKTLKERVEQDGALPAEEVTSIGLALCRALSHAHRAGVIHRDVKPGNVLVTPDGVLKLSDFGLAREGRGEDLSITGNAMGTGGFAAPEQMEDAKSVDHRADIFGLGAMLFQLATGKKPHVVKADMIPEQFREVILKAISERPEDRFFDINEMAVKLSVCGEKKKPKKKKAGVAFYLMWLVFISAILAGGYYLYDQYKTKEEQTETDGAFYQLEDRVTRLGPGWNETQLRSALNEITNMKDLISVEAGVKAAALEKVINSNLAQLQAWEALKSIDKQKDEIQASESTLKEAQKTFEANKDKAFEKDALLVQRLDWINRTLLFYDQLKALEESIKEESISGDKEALQMVRDDLTGLEGAMPWTNEPPSNAAARIKSVNDFLASQMAVYDLLAEIDKEKDSLKEVETSLRTRLDTLLSINEEDLPEELNGQFNDLKSWFEKQLRPFDFLTETEKLANETNIGKTSIDAALLTLRSGELEIPDSENERTKKLENKLVEILAALATKEYIDSIDKELIAGDKEQLEAVEQKLKELDIPDEFKSESDSLMIWIEGELSYLQIEKKYITPSIAEIKDLDLAKTELENFINKYLKSRDVSSASKKVKEIKDKLKKQDLTASHLLTRQQGMLTIIFGEAQATTKVRLAKAEEFLSLWKDHESADRIRTLIPDLRRQAKQEKMRARLLSQGFEYIETKRFFHGRNSNQIESYKHKKTGLRFVLVPGGTFDMGAQDGEEGSENSEKPRHPVSIKQFLLCQTEVTQETWSKIMETAPWKDRKYTKEGSGYAASYINWSDCINFCNSADLRLPTEAEWEYVCRAGAVEAYCFGDSTAELGDYAWSYDNTYDAGAKYAHVVKQKKPNAFGVYDMHGNVAEWCQDGWHRDYSNAPANGSAWESGSNSKKVVRGGSWYHKNRDLRSAKRTEQHPDDLEYYLGFRPAFTLD